MKLKALHLVDYVRAGGTMHSQFTAEQGYTMTVRPELYGVIVSRKPRDADDQDHTLWIPLANVRNGMPVEVPGEKKS